MLGLFSTTEASVGDVLNGDGSAGSYFRGGGGSTWTERQR